MNPFEIMTLVLTVFCFIGSGFALVVWSKINKASDDAEQAKKEASEKSERVKDELNAFKYYVAQEYPRRNELVEIEKKMEEGFKTIFDSVRKVGEDLNKMGNTFRDMLDRKKDKE